jgi:hypothetical protein
MKDILQYVVKNTTITDNGVSCGCNILELQKHMKSNYTVKDTAYAIKKLIELQYIETNMSMKSWNENHQIEDVTYAGHKYLESK